VPPQVSSYVVESYVRLRKRAKEEEAENKSHSYTSARTLLGVLRLAQALARLRFADMVEIPDVDEALRLMNASKESLDDEEDKAGADGAGTDASPLSRIYRLIMGMRTRGTGENRRRAKRQRRLGRGPGRERDFAGESDSDEGSDGDETVQELSMIAVRARVLGAGYTEVQLNETIDQVSDLWMLFSLFIQNG
jgi:DNA replication licensing factor MCM7